MRGKGGVFNKVLEQFDIIQKAWLSTPTSHHTRSSRRWVTNPEVKANTSFLRKRDAGHSAWRGKDKPERTAVTDCASEGTTKRVKRQPETGRRRSRCARPTGTCVPTAPTAPEHGEAGARRISGGAPLLVLKQSGRRAGRRASRRVPAACVPAGEVPDEGVARSCQFNQESRRARGGNAGLAGPG